MSTTSWPGESSSAGKGRSPSGPAVPRPVEGSASAPGTSATTGGATPAMPTGVAFTTRSAAATSLIAPTRPTGPASAAARSARAAVRLTTATSDAPCGGERQDRGTRRAARPDHHAPATVGVEPLVDPQRVEQAGAVGVVPHDQVAAPPHAVHRTQRLGLGRPLVDGRERRLLVRHGHRQASDAEWTHGRHGRLTVGGGHLERHEHPVEPRCAERRVEDDRRERVPDRAADERGQPGAPPRRAGPAHPQPRPASWQACLARSNSASVTVNTCCGRPLASLCTSRT